MSKEFQYAINFTNAEMLEDDKIRLYLSALNEKLHAHIGNRVHNKEDLFQTASVLFLSGKPVRNSYDSTKGALKSLIGTVWWRYLIKAFNRTLRRHSSLFINEGDSLIIDKIPLVEIDLIDIDEVSSLAKRLKGKPHLVDLLWKIWNRVPFKEIVDSCPKSKRTVYRWIEEIKIEA